MGKNKSETENVEMSPFWREVGQNISPRWRANVEEGKFAHWLYTTKVEGGPETVRAIILDRLWNDGAVRGDTWKGTVIIHVFSDEDWQDPAYKVSVVGMGEGGMDRLGLLASKVEWAFEEGLDLPGEFVDLRDLKQQAKDLFQESPCSTNSES